MYVGDLILDKQGSITYTPSSNKPLREFPLKDNKATGAIEIFNMPEKDNNGNIFPNR